MEDLLEEMDMLPLKDHNKSLQIDPNQLGKMMNGLYLLMLKEEMMQRDAK